MNRPRAASLCVLLAAISLVACDGAPTEPTPADPVITPASPEPGEAQATAIGVTREPTKHPGKVTVPDIRLNLEQADASPIGAEAATPSLSAKGVVAVLARLAVYARQRPTP